MNATARLLSALVVAAIPSFALGAEPQDISWGDLAPPALAIENPFEALSDEQMDGLRKILRLQAQAAQGVDVAGQEDALRAELTAEGLDIDALFQARIDIMQQRENQATAVNPDLVGASVRLPGYVLPLEFDGRKAVEFLLVPTVGACIHTPPPPANQIVHVVFPEGVEVNGLYTPVWISGVIDAETSVQSVGYVDGQAPISVGYVMRPVSVDKHGG